MCGRYLRRSDKQRIAEHFHIHGDLNGLLLPDWNYNVAPTTFQPVIRHSRETEERELILMRWGMVPHFAKSLADFKGVSTINTRADRIMTSAMWRMPFQRRRCLIPADGFYEWKALAAKTKQPYAMQLADGQPFAFAGIWDAWKEPKNSPQQVDTWLQSFSIITTDANELMQPIHNRMPVILHARDYDRWLTREPGSAEGFGHGQPPTDLLRPYESEAMQANPCSQLVGNVRNNSPDLLTAPLNSA